MKINFFAALAFSMALSGLSFSGPSIAQAADNKQEWAAKVVTLQQGPELDRLVEQLASSTTQDLLETWGPKLDAVPTAKAEHAKEQMNSELQKYSSDVIKSIDGKTAKVSKETLVPAYVERFSLDELKQIAAFFESAAIKKYQTVAPELGNLFIQKLIEETRADVTARAKQFDDAASKIVGATPAAKSAAPPAAKHRSTPKQ